MKTKMNTNELKAECKGQGEKLPLCPFCKGKAEFVVDQSGQLTIRHFPASGVVCPARYEQYCDSFEQGLSWWKY